MLVFKEFPMRIRSYGQNLIQLTQYPRVFPINAYLVREDDGFTLIDTGWSNNAPHILAAAQSFSTPIRRIVLTHAHSDHVGSLDAMHAALPDAEVMISARDARFLAGDMTLDPDEPQTKLRGGYVVCATKPTRFLNAGDRVGSLEVIASPGHTPGHLAFFDTREKNLIAGDSFQTQGGIGVAGELRILFPMSPISTWNRPLALATAKSLRALSPARLAVGHGPVLENRLAAAPVVLAMDGAIAVAERHVGKASAYAAK
jgi:glyoxylase-like metal-dependent hydrolase (beta-lactamase superfamily II)